MTSSITSSPSFRQRLAHRSTRATIRSAAAIIRTTVSVARRLEAPRPTAPMPAPASVTYVDDPDGRVRLVALRGTLDCRLVDELWAAVADDWPVEVVHIDFSDAEIAPEAALECLEASFDRAERCGIRLRVVGLDPEHPALLRRTSH